MRANKQHLGDGVSVEIQRGRLRLTTENAIGVTNEIVLKPEVYAALCAYFLATVESANSLAPSLGEAPRKGRVQ